MASARPVVVALVSDAIHPYHRGGKESRYHEIARRLSRRVEVRVHTMRWWDGPARITDDGVVYHALCPRLALYAGQRRSVLQAVVFAACCLRLLGRRFDVIEADHMPYLQLFTLRLVATVRRVPLVVTWHECWGPEYWAEYLGRLGVLGWWVERAAMRLPDRIIAASPETAARLAPVVGDRVALTVAPNGVDIDEIAGAAPSAEATDVAVVGRLIDHKRLDMLVAAVALLRDRGTPVRCRIIGAGPGREPLGERVRAAGLAELIELRHDVTDQSELYGLLKSARVFAFPSEREGFGIAVLEAIACGLPVVTTSAPGNLARHLVEDSDRGTVCAPTAEALATGIAEVLGRSPAAHASTTASAAASTNAWLRQYDWDAVTDRVAEAVLA